MDAGLSRERPGRSAAPHMASTELPATAQEALPLGVHSWPLLGACWIYMAEPANFSEAATTTQRLWVHS